jgi:uncharacterized protein (DUF885 family)
MRLFSVILLLSGALMAQSTPVPAERSKFAALAEEFIHQSLARSPISASYAGYHVHIKNGKKVELDALLDDVSPAAARESRDFYARWKQRFARELPEASLNPQERADMRLLRDQIDFALLEADRIQSYRFNPTLYVEGLGSALFAPLSQTYASKEVRLGHVLARLEQIPRYLAGAKQVLSSSDPIFVKVAVEAGEGDIQLIGGLVKQEIGDNAALLQRYDAVAPKAVAALQDFNSWLQNTLGRRKPERTWRLGKDLYAQKWRLVMQTDVTPEQMLRTAEEEMRAVRADMLQTALPLHQQFYGDHPAHTDVSAQERENLIIGEVMQRISDDHPHRDKLLETVKSDLDGIIQFIREKKIVSLSERNNLKVIPTPPFMRGIYSVAGFSSAPPLEPQAEAQYWVTPIDPKTSEEKAESRLREYNSYTLKWLTIHEALPGHYIQFEHANSVQPEFRRVLRSLYGNGPYVEGWAEYIAQVMMDAGFLNNDPRFRMVMRKLRLRVISNTILDIRMQTMGMTDQQAMDLMMKDAFQTQAEADGKLQRAKLSSAQLPTYYVGMRDWFDLRKKYEAAKGKGFDMLEFHDRALALGPLPISTVEELLLQH